jgi:hypothetical protein
MTAASFKCSKCGYDLRGLGSDGACPECGQDFSDGLIVGVEGKALIVRAGAILPARCIRTNRPVDTDGITVTLQWITPWIILAFLAIRLLGLLLYFLLRKKCPVTYFLSEENRKITKNYRIVGGGAMAAGALLLILGFATQSAIGIVGVLMFLVGVIMLAIAARYLRATKHKDGLFWVTGCSDAFLAEINENLRAKTVAKMQNQMDLRTVTPEGQSTDHSVSNPGGGGV